MTTINVGPYKIESIDAFLDKDDIAINNQTGIKVSLNEVASYIGMVNQQCDSEMASNWRSALTKANPFFLKDAEEYINSKHCISSCSKEAKPLLAVPGVNTHDCDLNFGNTKLPVIVSTQESYPELLNTKPDQLLLLLGGKKSENGQDWKFHTGNWHSYALHEYLNISPNTAFNDM